MLRPSRSLLIACLAFPQAALMQIVSHTLARGLPEALAHAGANPAAEAAVLLSGDQSRRNGWLVRCGGGPYDDTVGVEIA